VSIPDLDLTVRLVGLPLPELWSRYVAVGGSATQHALAERIAGEVGWPPDEDLFLAVALNDALLDDRLVSLNPLEEFLEHLHPAAGSAVDGRSVRPAEGAPHAVRPDGSVVDLDQLIVRAREAREAARRIRRWAQEARQRSAESTHDLVRNANRTTSLVHG
jgi:hypothetical protein